MKSCDIVTVVYFDEIEFLRLQARSISRWIEKETFEHIWIIINESPSDPRYDKTIRSIPDLYGNKSEKLKIINRNEVHLCLDNFRGYVSQQILKLQINRLITSEFYTVLDAKNFLVGPFDLNYLFDGSLPRARFETYKDNFQGYILNCYYDCLGVTPDDRCCRLPAMMTPFTFNVQTVRDSIEFLEKRLGRSLENCFAEIFEKKNIFSEFLLFGACNHARGLSQESIYSSVNRLAVTLWKDNSIGVNMLRSTFENALEEGVRVIGLHSRRIKQIDSHEREFLTDFFRRRAILAETDEFDLE